MIALEEKLAIIEDAFAKWREGNGLKHTAADAFSKVAVEFTADWIIGRSADKHLPWVELLVEARKIISSCCGKKHNVLSKCISEQSNPVKSTELQHLKLTS